DGVLGGQVHRPAPAEAIIHAGPGEVADGVVQVVHGHGHTATGELEYFVFDALLAVGGFPADGQFAGAGHPEVGGAVLVAEGMTADHDGVGPAGHKARHVFANDGLPEHGAAQDVADGAVGRLPHFLELEFLHPGFVRGDGGAFDAHAVLLDGFRRFHRDLVVGGIAVFDA